MKERKGIILAGGTGSRLYPVTKSINKQLLPIYDKPMIYYPLTTLMLADIRNILIITNPCDLELFIDLLGDGSKLGINLEFAVQSVPKGLAESFLIAEKFLSDSPSTLILGDNIFYGDGLPKELREMSKDVDISTVLAYPVSDPERYGVVEFNKYKQVISIEEKPMNPKSNYVITGCYFYDETVVERAKKLIPSKRGELEITDLNKMYLDENKLVVKLLSRGMAWLDTGTHESFHEASSFIKTIENRQGLKVGCPEEVAWRKGWINNRALEELAIPLIKSGYGEYLIKLMN